MRTSSSNSCFLQKAFSKSCSHQNLKGHTNGNRDSKKFNTSEKYKYKKLQNSNMEMKRGIHFIPGRVHTIDILQNTQTTFFEGDSQASYRSVKNQSIYPFPNSVCTERECISVYLEKYKSTKSIPIFFGY